MRRPLTPDVDPSELEPWLLVAFGAWSRGDMTQSQQTGVLRWIVEDLCGSLSIDPITMEPHQFAYTAGQRRVGNVILKLTGTQISPEGKYERRDDSD